MKKIIAVFISLIMIFSNLNAFAEATVHKQTSNVRIEGISAPRAYVTVFLVKKGTEIKDENIGHIGQTSANSKGEYAYKFKFDKNLLKDYDICVKAGEEDITSGIECTLVQGNLFSCDLNVTSQSGTQYIVSGDTVRLNARIDNLYGDNNQDYTIIFAGYNEKGQMTGMSVSDLFGASYDGESFSYANAKIPDGTKKIKAFIWGSKLNVPSPVADTGAEQSVNSAFTYCDGDTVAFIGDSITAGVGTTLTYPMYIEYFYTTRYPERNISFNNFGIPNDTAYGGLNRLSWDIYGLCTPTKATIMFGFNDIVWAHTNDGMTAVNTQSVANSVGNIKKIKEALDKEGVETVFITPTVAGTAYDKYPYVDPAMDLQASEIEKAASDTGVHVVDWHTTLSKLKKDGVNFLPDNIHPDEIGQTVMAYLFLKQQGVKDVAEVTVKNGNVTAENAEISDAYVTGSNISFTYKPNSLPLAATDTYKKADKLVGITQDINREIIKADVDSGYYEIKLNGVTACTVSSKELSEGVNIALSDANPNQNKALEISEILNSKDMYDAQYSIRHIAQMNQLMRNANVDYDSIDYNISETDPSYTNNVVYNFFNEKYPNRMDAYYVRYMKCRKNNESDKKLISDKRASAKAMASPESYKVEIIKK